MKKLLSILMQILAIVCFIVASEVDLELFSITVMTIGNNYMENNRLYIRRNSYIKA